LTRRPALLDLLSECHAMLLRCQAALPAVVDYAPRPPAFAEEGRGTIAHRPTADSHPACPTSESDLSRRKELHYLTSAHDSPLSSDDISNFYEETSRLVSFLGALAQAGPLAAAQIEEGRSPEWLEYFVWLNKATLNGKCFTPKDGKWRSLSEPLEVKRWTTIFA